MATFTVQGTRIYGEREEDTNQSDWEDAKVLHGCRCFLGEGVCSLQMSAQKNQFEEESRGGLLSSLVVFQIVRLERAVERVVASIPLRFH